MQYDTSSEAVEAYCAAKKRCDDARAAFDAGKIDRAAFDQVIRETYRNLYTESGSDRLTTVTVPVIKPRSGY